MSPIIRDPLAGIPAPTGRGDIDEALRLLSTSLVLVLTGAGMSTDSGIPDYRSPGSPKRTPMTVQAFLSGQTQRRRYWARSYAGWAGFTTAEPNSGHRDLAAIDPHAIVTQNVDGLHEAAGSTNVIDLHGRLDRVICLKCAERYDRDWLQGELDALNPGFLERFSGGQQPEVAPDGDVELDETADFVLRDCPACGGPLKPDVVYFGENVPRHRVVAAAEALDAADALLVLGSSLAVMSGLRFARSAARDGKPIVIVTDGPTRADELATWRVTGRVAPFLARWRARIGVIA